MGVAADSSRRRARNDMLVGAAILNLAGQAIHYADHVRLGIGLTPGAVLAAGGVAAVAGVLMLLLARAGHPQAPLAALALGPPAALGFAAVHLPAEWGAFSQPYGAGTDLLSWLSVAIAIACASALAAAGAVALKRAPARA